MARPWFGRLRYLLIISIVSFIGLIILIERPVDHPPLQPGNITYITLRSTKYWGVGNQMFAIASMVGINTARGLPWEYCLPASMETRAVFDLSAIPLCNSADLKDAGMFHEEGFSIYTPGYNSVSVNCNNHLVLTGYMQSWKYFKGVNISDTLRFKESIEQRSNSRIVELVEAYFKCSNCVHNVTLIGVHIRRGDYLTDAAKSLGFQAATLGYIYKAMDHMKEFVHDRLHLFIMSSDDIGWCKNQFINVTNVAFLTRISDPQHSVTLPRDVGADLAVLSKCNHSIMTVGTFGWWGAYLAGGHTVYYKDDLKTMSKLWNSSHHEDFFPPQWVGLS